MSHSAPTANPPRRRVFRHLLKRMTALVVVGAGLANSLCAVVAEEITKKPRRPNIVVILADDFGYGSAGCYGADPELVRTPQLDRLAKEGRRFTDANTTSSVCSPTRYSLLTGRYCWRTSLKHGVLGTYSPLHIETTRWNIASMLKQQGYATAAVGKWHLGYGTADDSPKWQTDYTAELSPGPLEIGFDYHFGVPSNHGDMTGVFIENRFVYGLRSGKIPTGAKLAGPAADDDDYQPDYTAADTESGRREPMEIDAPRRKNKRVMQVLTEKAIDWIERQSPDAPFFLCFTPVAVHNPVTPDDDLAGKSRAGLYGDWIHELDRSVGGLLDALDRRGLADDTLIVFTSDNGGVFKPQNKEQLQTQAIEAGLKTNGVCRGGKHDVWEGGFKVPFLARWPGRIPAGTTCDAMISLVDLPATTAELIGASLPPADQAAEDGRSFLPALLGKSDQARDDMIVHSSDGIFAIRRGSWKFIEGAPAEGTKQAARKQNDPQCRPQLYDTRRDPAETTDVAAANPQIVTELGSLLDRYRNGGFSRELPPIREKPAPKVAVLEPIGGRVLLDEKLAAIPGAPARAALGRWTAADGALWGAQLPRDKQGATFQLPATFDDVVIDYEICFRGADRHSLRIESADRRGSFRVEVSPRHVGLTKNPSRGEEQAATEPLARKTLELERDVWYPVRITIRGPKAVVQVNDTVIEGEHAVVDDRKQAVNMLVFGASAGFRRLRVVE